MEIGIGDYSTRRRFYANILKLNNLIMRFVSIPENGASWREKLIYVIDAESDVGVDLAVEIIDTSLGQLASLNIYNVTSAEIDIAPYLRASVDETPTDGTEGLAWSTAALSIVVRINGVESPKRLFYRAQLDCSQPRILSKLPIRPIVSLDETIRMTIFSPRTVEVRAILASLAPVNRTYRLVTAGRPVEFTLPLVNMPINQGLRIVVLCDGVQQASYDYVITPRDKSARQLVWYNEDGGVESYTFPKSVRLGYSADIAEDQSRVKSRRVMRRLCSAYESAEEIERIVQMIFSQSVYLVTERGCVLQRDIKRCIEFSPQGTLSQLKIDVVEEWRGGEL